MYGRRNPVLRHFGADELATFGTLHAIEERRRQGEFVGPAETAIERPTPVFDDYFEFDRPVPSGLSPNARDLLVEDTSSPTPSRRPGAAAYSYSSPSPGAYIPAADPSSPAPSPPLGSYDSSPSVGYHAGGAESGGSASGSVSGSPPPHAYPPSPDGGGDQRHPYGGYAYDRRHSGGGGSDGSPEPDPRSSPARSSMSRGTTSSRRPYSAGPSSQQPPFRSGVPASGPVREPGASGPAAGGRRRTTSSSPEASRSVSPSPQPSSDPANSEHRPSASDITSPGGAGATTRTPRRGLGLGAKISGRPLAVTPPPGGGGGGGGRRSGGVSPRGPSSSRPQRGGGGSTWAAAGRTSASGGARGRAPAWAPASGVANMQLEDEDEATRVAMMLNDPGARRDAMPPLPSPRGRQTTAADQQQQQQHDGEGGQALSLRPSPGPPQPGGEGFSPSPGYGTRTNRASDQSEQFYGQYRLRKHREPQGVPDFRFSQPRSHGAHAPVSQRYFSFDEAHPALAEQHYIRSPAQERALQSERRKLQEQRMRAARAEARSRLTSPRPGPSAEQLVADVDRLARVRDAGRERLRELEQEGEALRHQTRQVQRRALDVIARSELMSATASRSASPGPSPRPVHSRSRSPSASPHYTPTPASYDRSFYSYRGSASHRDRGTFGPPPLPPGGGYRSRSPSLSPGRQRPASASPGSVYQPGSPGGGGGGSGSYYDSPPAHRQQPQSYVGGGGGGGGYYSGGGGGGAAQRPLSAPPTSQGGLATHGSDEAREVLEMIDSVERLPQHEQTPVDDNGGGGADGDYLHRARSVATSRQLDTGLLDPDEQRIAMGAYDRSRYEEYQRQVDLEMQRRAVEGGYDSDVDRDEAAGLLVQDSEKIAAEEEERRRAEEAEREHRDAWMDEYRQRLGPEDGYLPQRTHSARELTFGGDVGGGGGGSVSSPPAQRRPPVLSESERGMLREPFVPLVSPELTLSPGGGYASEGPDGDHPHRRTRRRLFFKSTGAPDPFQFEERERARPKPIAKVKLEQDLALKRAEEEAARRRAFRAKPVPPAVVEPRYERMLLEAEAKRQLTHHQRLEELASMMEQPFSFYYRDRQQAEEREALARAAKDPNRFQVAFRARDVPQSTKEERFRALMIEMEAKREATRRRVEDARQAARERAAQEAAQRREAADRAYRERLRAVDPALHPYPPKPLGQVPDFNSLHRQFEVHMARARANIRKRVTVPQEFALNGSTADQQTERARKAQERRQRIILDMQLDSELLPETRWPHKSPRGKVRRTPPPPYLVEWMAQAPANRASSARRTTTAVAAAGGAYQTRAEREEVERKASEKLRAEALKRADRLLRAAQERRQKEAAAGGGGGGEGDDFGLASDVGATAAGGADPPSDAAAGGRGAAVRRRAAVAGRQDNPEVYVEARHAQVEKHVRVVVEETLLDQGIEAYRYVEGIGADKRNKAGGGGRRGGAA